MFVIKTISDEQFWTEKYVEENGFLKFDTKTKGGKVFNHELNKSQVSSINNVGEVKNKDIYAENIPE